jgi:1A family penicillin-binding protein
MKRKFKRLYKRMLKKIKHIKRLIKTKEPVKTSVITKGIKFNLKIGSKRWRIFFLGILFVVAFSIIPATVYAWYKELPKPEQLVIQGSNRSTKILDRNGKLLYEIYQDRKYNPVTLDKIPDYVIKSTLAVEDDQFYKHHGIRPLSIIRAAKATIFDDELQGGSTITQQLVKNVLLTQERTISRKIKEVALSLLVEKKYTKNQILELYLNNTPYGGTAWGIEAASQKYFAKDVWDLDLAEASFLAGLPSSPTMFSPFGDNAEFSKQRQKVVLNRMTSLGYISKEDSDKAYAVALKFAPQVDTIRAPHFVWYVRDLLNKQFGSTVVDNGGLTVTTTLDLDLQTKIEEIVKNQIDKSKYLNITNGAVVVLDPKTGDVLAYVGSKDYFAEGWGAYDVLTGYRQPGSSIKPVTYALAFTNGMTTTTTIEDSPVTFKNAWETYTPVNYDGKFHGLVTLRQALANSYNVPAVKLLNKLGADNMVVLGSKMGLKDWQVDSSYGISVTLGGKEVRPIDLANVYATLARDGVYKDVTPFISIRGSQATELYKGNDKEEIVVKPEAAYLVTNILSDYYARLPAFGTNNFLSVSGHDIAVKTGTTDLKKDNWTLGYTPSYVVGVWVGNNDNTPMNRFLASGLSGAAPIWNQVMQAILQDKPNEKFIVPDGVITKYYKDCNKSEVFIKGTAIPDNICPSADSKNKDKKN